MVLTAVVRENVHMDFASTSIDIMRKYVPPYVENAAHTAVGNTS